MQNQYCTSSAILCLVSYAAMNPLAGERNLLLLLTPPTPIFSPLIGGEAERSVHRQCQRVSRLVLITSPSQRH